MPEQATNGSTNVFVVCPNTIIDFFDEDSKNSEHTKLFFNNLAEKRNEIRTTDSKEFRGCISFPIHNHITNEIIIPYLKKLENDKLTDEEVDDRLKFIRTVLSALEIECEDIDKMDIYESVFELAKILNDEYNIIIVSNYPEKLEAKKAELKAKNNSNNYDIFKIINTKTALLEYM